MRPAPLSSTGAASLLRHASRLAMACAAALLVGACANQAPAPETSLYQFNDGGFQAAEGYHAGSSGFSAWNSGQNVANADTTDAGYASDDDRSDEAEGDEVGSRWDTGVTYEPTYAYRGGRDPRTGLASGQM